MKLVLAALTMVFSLQAFGEDLQPYRFEYSTGDVQAMSEDSLTYIDNSAVFLNPDQEGKHVSLFLYKVKDLQDVPYLEVRAKSLKGIYEFAILEGKDWQPLGTFKGNDQWARKKFDLGNMLSDYANKDGIVKVRVRAKSKKVKSLELDYIGITTDKPIAEQAPEKPTKEASLDLEAPEKTAEI